MRVILTWVSRTKCRVEGDGLRDTFNPDKEPDRQKMARRIGVDDATLLAHLPQENEPTELNTPDPNASRPITVTVRPRVGSERLSSSGEALQTISEALVRPVHFVDPVIEWINPQEACFLDVDYHGVSQEHVPNEARLRYCMASIQPQPCLWFRSKGGGVHALYIKQGAIAANVLAAVAGFSYSTLDSLATFDVIARSRLAGDAEVHRTIATSDMSVVSRFLRGGVTEGDVEGWLNDKGLQKGQRYTHDVCPCDSGHASHGEPVYVGDAGITCHSCGGRGLTMGSRRPGFFPYSSLCGSHEMSDVARMVDNFTHWPHAELVLDTRCRLRGTNARLAYEGMLRLRHGDDERISSVFSSGQHIIRGNGRWVTPTRYETLEGIRPTLALLPATQYADGRPNPERLDMFEQTADLGDYGYPTIKPLHGVRIYGEFLGNDGGGVTVVLPPVGLQDPGAQSLRPRYTPESSRLALEDAWQRVETVFPGINRSYLLLLLAARGVSEGESGIAPNILCTGPSKTGKSTTVHVASSIVGDGLTEVPYNSSVERYRQGIMDAVDRGSYVVTNELIKNALAQGKSAIEAFDVFLNMTPDSVSHKMYVGPVSIGRLPVMVVTDIEVPQNVITDIQIARRFIHVHLAEQIEWEKTILGSGVGMAGKFRATSVENAEAGNALISHVIDRWFKDRPRTLTEIANDLGFTTLQNSDTELLAPDSLIEFFHLVCDAPPAGDHRYKGPGWTVITQGDDTLLAECWKSMCDEDFTSCRKVTSTEWSTVVGVPIGTRCDIMKHGKKVAVRFRYGDPRHNPQVNKQLLTCEGRRRG